MALNDKQIEILSVRTYDWTIPMYGNIHSVPYGSLLINGIVDGKKLTDICKTYGDRDIDFCIPQYVVFGGVRFKVINKGSTYYPKIELERWYKEKVNNRWMYLS